MLDNIHLKYFITPVRCLSCTSIDGTPLDITEETEYLDHKDEFPMHHVFPLTDMKSIRRQRPPED